MTPSGWKARHGWRESSIAISAVSDLCRKPYLSENSLNSAMYLPACRISHTGGRSLSSPRATRRSSGSAEAEAFSFMAFRNNPWVENLMFPFLTKWPEMPTPHKAVACDSRAGMPQGVWTHRLDAPASLAETDTQVGRYRSTWKKRISLHESCMYTYVVQLLYSCTFEGTKVLSYVYNVHVYNKIFYVLFLPYCTWR